MPGKMVADLETSGTMFQIALVVYLSGFAFVMP